MTIRAPKKENMIALLLFMAVMMLKICALVALCTTHNHYLESQHDDAHPHHKIKKYTKTAVQSNGQKYVM